MAWDRLSLTRVLLLGLLAPLAAAGGDAKNKGGSSEGLAYEPIEKVDIYTDNATAAVPKVPPVEGWWESKICSGVYCVFTNRRVAKGRGIALVTKLEDFQKVERHEDHLNKAENRIFEDPVPFVETEVHNKGIGLTANKTIRRGRPLMSWSPVLMVHRGLFDDVPKKKERTRLLEAAVSFLPDATRAAFDRQRARPGDTENAKPRSIEEILLAHPFEVNLGFTSWRDQTHSRHYVNYPEVAVLQHDCRPNVASYIDESFSLRTTVARRVQPGDELTITYVDPMWPRAQRSEWVQRHRGHGVPCPCAACSPPRLPGSPENEEIEKADKRLEEILAIRAELRNHESKKVTFDMIERFIKLVQEDRLHVKFAEAYELAALNFNYYGDDKRAKKYADLAVQAGIVEGGPQANDVVALRIMASDIKGHYSYRYVLKRRGQ